MSVVAALKPWLKKILRAACSTVVAFVRVPDSSEPGNGASGAVARAEREVLDGVGMGVEQSQSENTLRARIVPYRSVQCNHHPARKA
jgi:hypothetical protein